MRPIIPYPTGRIFRGSLSQALRARLRSALSPTGHDVLLFLVDPPRHNGTDAILSVWAAFFGLTLDLFSSQGLGLPLNGFFPYLKQRVTLRKVYGRIF